MKSLPKISFVIPIRNRAEMVLDALRSLQAQTMTEWEAIVVDDHSTDNPERTILNFDSRVHLVKLPDIMGQGVSCARNYGNMCANADLIAVLDSDDLAMPNRAELAIKSYIEHKWDFYCTRRENINELTGIKTLQNLQLQAWDTEEFIKASFVGHSTVVYTKKAAMEIPYNSTLTSVDDYDLISRFIALNKKMFLDPEVTTIYRVHEGERITTHIKQEQRDEELRLIRLWRGWDTQ